MGKHRRKHKCDKKKSVTVSEFEEKKKVREAILKVFRARLESSNHGGALVVDSQSQHSDGAKLPTKQSDKTSSHARHRKRKEKEKTGDGHTHSPTASFTDGRMSGRDRHKEVSKRKKYTKTSNQTKQIEKESAVSKHMKIARGITYGAGRPCDLNCGGGISSRARPRLTHKFGLVSSGKKSATVTRELMVPEHINREAQKEIKKMVENIDVCDEIDLDAAERMVFSPSFSSKMTIKTPMSGNTPSTKVKSSGSASRMKHDTQRSSKKDGFPKVLPLWDTVDEILSTLKPVNRQMYPARDYLREDCTELLKIYKQNAPRTVTPTPVPLLNKNGHSGSIQRSLMKFYSPVDGHPSQHLYDNRGEQMENTDEIYPQGYAFHVHSPKLNFSDGNPFIERNSELRPGKAQIQQSTAPIRDSSTDLHHRVTWGASPTVGDVLDGIDSGRGNNHRSLEPVRELRNRKIHQNVCVQAFTHGQDRNPSKHPHYFERNFTSSSKHTHRSGEGSGEDFKSSSKHRHRSGDFTSFFYGPREDDIFMGRDVGSRSTPVSPVIRSGSQTQYSPLLCYEKMDTAEPLKDDAEQVLQINNVNRFGKQLQQSILGRCSTGADNLSGGSHCAYRSQSSAGSSQQVMRRRPEFMPSFHGNYYSDHMTSQDLAWPHVISPALKMGAGMDILDLVDKDVQPDCRGDRQASSESHTAAAGTQSHPSSHLAAGHKPVLPLPDDSPCERTMYPRKMY